MKQRRMHSPSSQRGRRPLLSALRVLAGLAIVATAVTVLDTPTSKPAGADTPYTFSSEEFNEANFPPTNWTTPEGTWAANCATSTPVTGCSATATVSGGNAASSWLEFDPTTVLPANLENPTITFYSDFDPDATTQGDNASVMQASVAGDDGDFNTLVSIDGPAGDDATGTEIQHIVPLANDNFPIEFRWTSFGDSSTTGIGSWAISDVTITGTLPSTPYSLTANPVSNTAYPHVVAGNTVTIALSGSSNPTGDSLEFSIARQPTLGTLGTVTQVDATDATVTYTSPANACPDPTGNAAMTCSDPFTFTVTDLEGNTSSPAQVDLSILPGGAGSEKPAIDNAPASATYETLIQNSQQVQGADLSGVTVGPSDFPDEMQLELQASTGIIDLPNGVASGATFIDGTASGDREIYLTGSATKLSEAIGEFLYFPPSGTTPAATVNFYLEDMGATGSGPYTNLAQATIDVSAQSAGSPPPSLSMPTGTLSIANNAGPLTFPAGATTGFSLTDAGASADTQDTVLMSVSGGTLALPAADTSGPTQLVTLGSGGIGTLDMTGTVAEINQALPDLTFDPSNLPSGTVSLNAEVEDPDTAMGSPVESIQIVVVQAPFAFGTSSFTTLENTPATVWLCASGPSGDALEFSFSVFPGHGSLATAPSANPATSGCSPDTNIEAFTFTPSSNYVGPDSFTYSITDPTTGLNSGPNVMSITVGTPPTPTAYDVAADTEEGQSVNVVLCGQNPVQGSTLRFTVISGPGQGTLTDNGPATIDTCNQGNTAEDYTYAPSPGTFTSDGTDTFQYVTYDGTDSLPATGTITVSTLTPQVIGYSATVNENSSILLDLCSTLPSSPITFAVVGQPGHGTLDQNAVQSDGPACPNGYYNLDYEHYTPDPLYHGTDSFSYEATGGPYTSSAAVIDITVAQVEIPPTANTQSVLDVAPAPVDITLSGSSIQGSALTYEVLSEPSHGTLSGTAPDLVYTPSVNGGQDSFTFVANDGVADSPAATVTIDVTTPALSSSVCYAAPHTGFGAYSCNGSLTSVPDPTFGALLLAHTSGQADSQVAILDTITNTSAATDTVTVTAPAGTVDWPLDYDAAGSDNTAAITGAGLQITLGPAGSGTASTQVVVNVFTPHLQPAPPVTSVNVTAVSGNDPAVSTSAHLEVQNGTSSPSLELGQSDGSGSVTFPNDLAVAPTLYDSGPAGGIDIEAGLTGTGVNTFLLQATIAGGSTSGVTPTFYLGTTNVTAAVLAGTEAITCYAEFDACPPLSAVLTPGSSGKGYFDLQLSLTSTIDGQSAYGLATATLASTVQPDLYTINPDNGAGVYETTPVTQMTTAPVELNGSESERVFLANAGDVADTYTVRSAVTKAGGDASAITIGASEPAIYGETGAETDVTTKVASGSYNVTIPVGEVILLVITDDAVGSMPAAPPQVVLTATSQLDPAKVDAYQVTFPAYSYRPDALLTAQNGTQIGSGVYQQSYPGPVGDNQETEYNVSLAEPAAIDITLQDQGQGPWPNGDHVVVTAPTVSSNFNVSYTLQQNGASTNVTSAITGSGLDVTLNKLGGPAPVIVMTASASVSALAGIPGWYPITVTSQSSLPSGLADVVVVGLYNQGESQLRLGGLPQPEPADITADVQDLGLTNRVAPLPDAGYAPGVTYGAYSDPTGQKFAYMSTYDTFNLQVFADEVSPVPYRIQMVDPGAGLSGLPQWERDVFSEPYFNGSALDTPTDPMLANPDITAGGQNITTAVENGSYTTAALGTDQSTNISVSFSPPAGTSLRYSPLKFELIDASTGQIEDVLVIDPSSIVTCTSNGSAQQQITGATGHRLLNFEADDRADPANSTDCLEQLTSSWISNVPVVFGAYVPATSDDPAGGGNPEGLWLNPLNNSVIQINDATLAVTSTDASATVDSPLLEPDGSVDAAAASAGYQHSYYVGTYPNLVWNTTDGTNGLEVQSASTLPSAPFPLVSPSDSDWPNNTMTANRYFQVNTTTGTPVLVGEMDVDVPWYNADVPILLDLSPTDGLELNYNVPADTTVKLPGDDSVTFYNFYWTTTTNGVVTQGGCLGIPSELFTVMGLGSGPNECLLGATVTFSPISPTPGVEAKVSQITVALMNPGIGVKGSPEFNFNSFSGEIDLDPATQDVTKVVLDPVFGVGPPTPCQVTQNNDLVTGLSKLLYLPCPTNFFFFNAKITYQQGGFDNGNSGPDDVGLQFSGTLTFLNIINLSNIEADISTDPFNFHFSDSPIDLSISPSIPVSANVSFSGDVGASGFALGVSGGIYVDGTELLGASGELSTIGLGVCGTLAGDSLGFGEIWGDSPQIYASGCTTSQYDVGS
jgi:hypothetical protein